jgi:uncharacterized protein YkwD
VPARPTLLVVGVLAVVAAAVAQPGDSSSGGGSSALPCSDVAERGATEAAFAARLIELVNAHRRSLGLRRLGIGRALTRSAAWKADHMARHEYLSHSDMPSRRTLAQRLRSCGFTGTGWGEVLAVGQRWPSAVLRAWGRSGSHRAVIEAPWWRYAGAGVARSRRGDLYWALDFGA